MFSTKKITKISYRVWLNKSKSKDGLIPVYFRIVGVREKTETALGFAIKENDFDIKREAVKTSSSLCVSYNSQINAMIELFHKAHLALVSNDDIIEITPQLIRDKMLGKDIIPAKKVKILQYSELIDEFINEMELDGQHTTLTIKRYKTQINAFNEYLKVNKLLDIKLSQLTAKHLKQFEAFLFSKQLEHNTVIRYIKAIKTTINYAINNGYINYQPFAGYKQLRMKKKPILYITSDELLRIESKEFGIERLNKVRDFFLIQCYTGMSYADVCNFSIEKVKEIEGQYFIITTRQKSDIQFTVPILKKAVAIFKKYNWRIPISSNQRVNGYLKEIAEICKITTPLTTHIGRKTFATLALTKGVSIDVVSRMVGHTNVKMTMDAYADVLTEKMIVEMQKLED